MTGRGRHLKCQRFQFWLFMNYPSCSEISFLIMGKTLLVRTFLPLIGLTKFQAFVSNIPGNHRATGNIWCNKPHIALETIFGGVRSIAWVCVIFESSYSWAMTMRMLCFTYCILYYHWAHITLAQHLIWLRRHFSLLRDCEFRSPDHSCLNRYWAQILQCLGYGSGSGDFWPRVSQQILCLNSYGLKYYNVSAMA